LSITSPVAGSSSGGPAITVPGIGTGLDTTALVNALLASYEQPITNLQAQQQQISSLVSLWQGISSDLGSLQQAAAALSTPADWQATQVTSSSSAVATGTTSGSAQTGSVSFVVDQLAQGEVLVSSGAVAATSDVVTPASSLLVSSGTEALGFSSLSGSGLTLGAHSISVTQASAAATVAGTTALGSSTTISSSNDTITLNADGTSYTLTVAAGNYTPQQLAQAISSAAGAAGAPVVASVNSSGDLVLSTTNQGSAASLQVTGGTALSALGLSAMSSAVTGTNAVVNVDGTANTVTGVTAGGALNLSSGTGGTVTAVVGASASLSVGNLTAQNVSTGNGSLADVVSAINSAGTGVTASAISNGSGGYLLELSSTSTGTNANIGIPTGAFAGSALGNLQVAQAAQDAEISLGGSAGPVISSSTNQVSGLLPGLTAQLVSASTTPVTLTVSPDASGMASKVSTLVDAANKVLSDISSQSQYDPSTQKGGPLLGSGLAESITQQVLSIFSTVAGTSGLGNVQAVGITESNGQLSFNQSAFESAFQASPQAVEGLFAQGGTFSPSISSYAGQVSLIYAGTSTQPGTYQVVINHSATQATGTGTVAYSSGSSTVGSSDTLTVTMGSQSVSYQASAGETLSAVAQGLDQAFANAGLNLSAQVVSGPSGYSLQVTSAGYGSSQSFSVSESGSDFGLAGGFSGTDVSGTINGVAATGNGQVLSAPTSDPVLAGLSLEVTVPGITSATTIGSYTYNPGVGQALDSVASNFTSPTGEVTSEINNLQQQSLSLNPEIAMYQQIANEEKAMLEAQFSQLDATLASLGQQSSYLASALGGSSGSSSGSSGSGSTIP
jgi:flagellar hook-associated protein 2